MVTWNEYFGAQAALAGAGYSPLAPVYAAPGYAPAETQPAPTAAPAIDASTVSVLGYSVAGWWVGLALALVVIRILWENGARVD